MYHTAVDNTLGDRIEWTNFEIQPSDPVNKRIHAPTVSSVTVIFYFLFLFPRIHLFSFSQYLRTKLDYKLKLSLVVCTPGGLRNQYSADRQDNGETETKNTTYPCLLR